METVTLFQTLYDCPGVNMRRIFPTMQAAVKKIHDTFYADDRVSSIILFGSAASMRCNQNSDIDLLIRLRETCVNTETKNNISETVQELCGWNADILWYDRINEHDRVYQDILKGVQIV